MAKKKAAAGFNMAEEVRTLLKDNPKLTGREVYEGLQKKFPGEKINEKSCTVSFSAARKKLGLPTKRRGGGRKAVVRKIPSAARPVLDVTLLQAAAKFISEAGGAQAAVDAVRQVQSLQLK